MIDDYKDLEKKKKDLEMVEKARQGHIEAEEAKVHCVSHLCRSGPTYKRF